MNLFKIDFLSNNSLLLGKSKKFLLANLLLVNLCSAVPVDTASILPTTDQTPKQWKIVAAKNALDVGLFHIAENLYREVYDQESDPTVQQIIGLQLASTLINEAKYVEASKVLSQIPEKNSAEAQLLLAVASFSKNADLSKKLIEQINVKELSPEYQPWLYITKGLIAQTNLNLKEARNYFQEAQELAKSESLKLHIDTLLFRIENSSGKSIESLEKNLKKKLEKDKNAPHATTLKQYAIVLDDLGKKEEAVELLEKSLDSLAHKDVNETDSIILLTALIAGPETEKGRISLEKIVERKQDIELSKVALSILAQQVDTNGRNYLNFLNKLIEAPQQHPLIDTLLIQRAQLALSLQENDIAQADTTRILDEYPGSNHYTKALRILAYIAWSSDPPRYRIAADILTKLAKTIKDGHERAEINMLIADCYFLNNDYENAARLYTTLLQDSSHKLPKGPLVYQLVLCAIHEDNFGAAERILEKYRNDQSIDSTNLWRAEWNLINSMKINGQIGEAFKQIEKLLKDGPPLGISDELKLRLLWLKAELLLASGNPEETTDIIDTLLDLLKTSKISIEQKDLIASYALLLKGQALLEFKKDSEFLAIIKDLREAYPNSKAAILSYITEAHYYASINNPTKAQQQLINLSDNYPDSEYAAISLYEAALNAENRGLKNTYQEALAILERLNSDYPSSPLVYNARFKQGDILRKLGDFSNAQLLYENLIKQYPDHPKKARCELALLDCIFAQTLNNPSSLNEVATRYIHLFDSPLLPINLRAEAGFKAGFAFIKASQMERAQEVLWLAISTLLINSKNEMNDQGRYWIARCIFELGGLLEKTGSTRKANEVYQLISSYQLPGSALANSKIK